MVSNPLEMRIAALQAELQAVKYPQQSMLQQQVQQPPMPVESTEEMVKRLIDERLSEALAVASPPQPQQSASMDFGVLLLRAIGSGLTVSQQQWLSLPENQVNIPDYLMTIEGQAITLRFLNGYTEYKETKCK